MVTYQRSLVDRILLENLKAPQTEIVKANLCKNLYAWNTAITYCSINSLKKELKKHDNDLALEQSTKPWIGEMKKMWIRWNKMENRVYKITSSVCPKTYIRHSGSFDMRYKYHWPDPRIGKQRSSFAQLQHEWYKRGY